MSKSVVVMLVLVFLIATWITVTPALSSADLVENSWATKAPMSQARSGLGVAVVNGKIYAIGGQVLVYQSSLRTESKEVGTNEEYNPTTNTWTMKSPMPTPSSGFATAVYQDKIYCLGKGINEVYDPATDEWENKTSTHIPIAQANVVNGKIYVIGGYPNNTLNEVYDPLTDTWTMKAPIPKPAAAASGVLDNKIYFIGGYFDKGYISITQIYDPANDVWSIGSPPPTYFVGRSAGAATTGLMAPKRIYVFNHPYADLAAMPNDPLYTNQVYDAENDSWVAGAGIPTSRQDFSVAIVDDIIYVIGGFSVTYPSMLSEYKGPTITYYATVEQYTPFGYGTAPPIVDVASPVNQIYNASSVSLDFMLNKPAEWIGYSLDGQDNITIHGNTTLDGLSNGPHDVTVYARDELNNTGVSATVTFTVDAHFPTALVAASTASATIIGIGLILYFKKRKH
jgi:hypothetical protein